MRRIHGSDAARGRRQTRAVRAGREALLRSTNVAMAVVALIVTLPLWLLVAIAIRLTSAGPVFYAQERVGLDRRASGVLPQDPRRRRDLGGRPFRMYKFRTMVHDAERSTGAVWSPREDPRVTPLGRVLRRYRIDELPQLLNVLRAEMSVVGPRPERPAIFAQLRDRIPGYALRQRALPGITGLAQVNLEYDTCVEDVAAKLAYDLQYLRQRSVLLDLAIMARTVVVVLFRDRALRRLVTAKPTFLVNR